MKITIKPFEIINNTGVEFEEEAEYRFSLKGEYCLTDGRDIVKSDAVTYRRYPVLTPKEPTGADYLKSLPVETLYKYKGFTYVRVKDGVMDMEGNIYSLRLPDWGQEGSDTVNIIHEGDEQ